MSTMNYHNASTHANILFLLDSVRTYVQAFIPPESEYQKRSILNRLNDCEHAVNGLTDEDFKEV